MEEQPTTEKKEIIHQMTELDMLKSFRNEHLEKYISSKIYTKLYAEMYAPNDIVIQVIQPSGQPGLPGIERKLKAKEVQESELKINDKERKVLIVIDKLIAGIQKNGETKIE